MITTTIATITTTIEQRPNSPSSSSSSLVNRTTLLTGLKVQDDEQTDKPSQQSEIKDHEEAPLEQNQTKRAAELISSPKIGEWSEGSSYPSGFGIRIDSRSHLEVFDQKHRYGKNLRMYYKEWVRNHIEMQFFDWLNSPNLPEVAALPLAFSSPRLTPPPLCPSVTLSSSLPLCASLDLFLVLLEQLVECPRALLDLDTVFYCKSDSDREQCLVRIGINGKFYHRPEESLSGNGSQSDQPQSPQQPPPSVWKRLTTHGEGNGWIFVLKNNPWHLCA
jgi:hypothetical protein